MLKKTYKEALDLFLGVLLILLSLFLSILQGNPEKTPTHTNTFAQARLSSMTMGERLLF